MKKHAYLIMAHNEKPVLISLLKCLDHERNDIYIHLDKKSKFRKEEFVDICKKSRVYFTKRINVHWGGYSQINAEMILLETAVSNGTYAYYHLLTGVDLPLKTQDEILAFFDKYQGKEFLSVSECNDVEPYINRVKYYYPLQEMFSRNSYVGEFLKRKLLQTQKKLRVNRLTFEKYGMGSAYFDITDEFARYVVSKKEMIKQNFKKSVCADEIFMQTLFLNQDYFEKYVNPNNEHPYIQKNDFDILRAIDWKRGRPYIYTIEDYEMLMSSGCLFARKFSSINDSAIIEKIIAAIN